MADPADILVIDDEESICYAFRRCFEGRSWRVRVTGTAAAGLEAYRDRPADVVFLDVRLPDASGLDVLADLRRADPDCRVVVITAHGSLETVRRAVEGRAFEYLAKPIDLDRAVAAVEEALAARRVGARAGAAAADPGDDLLVGASPAIQEVYKRISRAARTGSTVLVLGETGTGKELVARAIHAQSGRADGPFVPVNCAALPDHLVESELFGHARGAFTGADADKPGRLETADGGTVFLDEVGELPAAAQVKLLRFLDDQVIERLGSVAPIRVDVRVLAATNRDLAGAVAAGAFRRDLFYRLAVIQIEVPPLRDRPDDVPALVAHFLASPGPDGPPPAVSREAMDLLTAYPWLGNVRELRNAVEHAVAVSGGGPILPSHLPERVRRGEAAAPPAGESAEALLARYVDRLAAEGPGRFRIALAEVEKAFIRQALGAAGGNLSAAADRLGIHRNTLRAKIQEFGLDG